MVILKGTTVNACKKFRSNSSIGEWLLCKVAAMVKESLMSRLLSKDKADPNSKKETESGSKRNSENGIGKPKKTTLTYDRLTLLAESQRLELIADIRERIGVDVVKLQIQKIDLKESLATLTIWYHDRDETSS